ncbi:MAG: branched-chain amino acid ABC transporter permease [Candidatus Dormibacteraeota bacterium]|nr:branched-chain amino acid ABC transporter permease [Candidatus Dormibacteraeota bacterium]MBO0703808.1 branched-chain amino acid ABC transporter permease [Candidatus Dormibacteraeota bacterium]MBO0760124.1 branched-chain amino acid ABC transporter permease [Candidatus Dormibacteraeota bacterium]
MVQSPTFFVQILVLGVTQGAIYALVALGYTLVYGIMELINFAHGDVFALGGFVSLTLFALIGITPQHTAVGALLVPAVLGVIVATMLINGGVNMAIERIAYRPLRNAPKLASLITAIGMSFILEGILFLWKGPVTIPYPNLLPEARIPVGGASIGVKDLIVIGTTAVLLVLLGAFVAYSKLGKAMRATSQDRDAALLMGININRTIAATFFIGAALAGVGGTMYGLYFPSSLYWQTGFSAGLAAFTAAVLGGIGNIQGAALGGLLIGLVRTFNDGYGSAQWSDVLVFAILVVVLTFRPTGLLGMQVPNK